MISIISAIWQRHALTKIFLDSLARYRKDYGILSVVAGSEGKTSYEMCAKRGISYIETRNKPISGKFIAASRKAFREQNPKAIIVLGSDDFLDDNLIKNYIRLVDEVDVLGLVDCYFYHTGSKEAMYWKGYTNFRKGETIGMGRMVSRKVFDALKGKLWPSNIDSGLDYNMMKKIRQRGFKQTAFNIEGMVAVDIKGQQNITGFDCYRSNMIPISEEILDKIPEFKRIKEL